MRTTAAVRDAHSDGKTSIILLYIIIERSRIYLYDPRDVRPRRYRRVVKTDGIGRRQTQGSLGECGRVRLRAAADKVASLHSIVHDLFCCVLSGRVPPNPLITARQVRSAVRPAGQLRRHSIPPCRRLARRGLFIFRPFR